MQKLLVILGPTATGKSDLAMHLAQSFNGEIVSADSVLVYRGLDIGSAKPTLKERLQVPHHCIDIVEPTENYTVADFQQDAALAIDDITSRGKLPILVGGTGLYIRAVLKGYSFSEDGIDENLRQELRSMAQKMGPQYLHQRLANIDPSTAKKLHPNDLRRVIRALEVYEKSKTTISNQAALTSNDNVYDALIFGLTMPRDLMYQRIEERVEQMMTLGLVDEVKGLIEQGVPPDTKSLQSLGYKQVVDYLLGNTSCEDTVRLIKRDTRRFAKRQLTWFRRDKEINWLDLHELGGKDQAVLNISQILAGHWQ